MTGLGWYDTRLYTSTTDSTYEGCYSFVCDGQFLLSKQTYISEYIGTEIGYDITYLNGNIWMANDNATSPVGCYQETSGAVLDRISADIGIGSDIRGVTYEIGTDAFLWVSNCTTDKLYRIDLSSGIVHGAELDLPGQEISFSSNPFHSSVVITENCSSSISILDIYDSAGRVVESSNFIGTYTWYAHGLPAGAYIITVSDSSGNQKFAKILKL